MEPTLLSGQSVLIDLSAYRKTAPEVGEIILISHPLDPQMLLLKRVQSIDGERVFAVGDNLEASTDSRTFGPITLDFVRGKVRCTFP
jgi:nickel-type superoxide dismutase maturation protease